MTLPELVTCFTQEHYPINSRDALEGIASQLEGIQIAQVGNANVCIVVASDKCT